MRRWNDRIFRKHLGRIAVLFCLAVLLAGCSGSESAVPPPILPPADTENQTAHKAQLKHTLAELGSVTPSNATDGMDANRLFAGEAEDALGVWVETDKNERIWRPIVAAVDAASVEIRPGEEKMVYWYVFLPEENGAWTQMHWGSREEQRGRFSPIPHKTA